MTKFIHPPTDEPFPGSAGGAAGLAGIEPARPVPVQGRALRTRAALLAAVETLVASEGAGAVTTTRVADAAGVSVGTLYRYFADRDDLLLAAYDATVERIVAACAKELEILPDAIAVEEAARRLLAVYLDAAEAIPSHAGLLKAMRAIRPVEADQSDERSGVVAEILAPFLARFASPGTAADPVRLSLLNVLMGTLVDLYLVTRTPEDRAKLRREIEAHMLLAVARL
ncbi:MAG TPA: TetR/AcrR family transcriptional regulator [Rhizobiales bacterium]|nr:TetR/AcrR family transcriptional regulator [Hyphomicrobiales bacterium]